MRRMQIWGRWELASGGIRAAGVPAGDKVTPAAEPSGLQRGALELEAFRRETARRAMAIDGHHPHGAVPSIAPLVHSGENVGRLLPVGRDVRVADRLEREIIFRRDAALRRMAGGNAEIAIHSQMQDCRTETEHIPAERSWLVGQGASRLLCRNYVLLSGKAKGPAPQQATLERQSFCRGRKKRGWRVLSDPKVPWNQPTVPSENEPDPFFQQPASDYWVIKEHFDVELFCEINTPFRARPTREALRGIYRGPGERRGAPRPDTLL